MSIGKSLRFKIFARDSFTCQYCGTRPPDVVLEVDHIHPVSKGGRDEDINLITSCFDCNRGKSAKVISEVAPRPDANIALLAVQQEIAEAKRYLEDSAKRDAAHRDVCDRLRDVWSEFLTDDSPVDATLLPWILKYGAEEVEKCIKLVSPSYRGNRFGRNEDRAFDKLVPYMAATLRNRGELSVRT